MTGFRCLVMAAASTFLHIYGVEAADRPLPDWAMGPFFLQEKPVLSPTSDSTFDCPVERKKVHWDSEYDWETKGFTNGATVANTLVPFKGQWLLYYGAADRHIGLAVFTPKAGSLSSLTTHEHKTGSD